MKFLFSVTLFTGITAIICYIVYVFTRIIVFDYAYVVLTFLFCFVHVTYIILKFTRNSRDKQRKEEK